jgi:hypothetical protein
LARPLSSAAGAERSGRERKAVSKDHEIRRGIMPATGSGEISAGQGAVWNLAAKRH